MESKKRSAPRSGAALQGKNKQAKSLPGKNKQWRPAGKAGVLSGGLRGVLVTCMVHRQREASAEALALLRDQIAVHRPADDGGASPATCENVEDEIEAELASMKADRTTLYQVDTGIKGCLLVALRKGVEAETEALVAEIFTEVMAQRMSAPRYIARMSPLAITTSAKLSEVTQALIPLLAPFFGPEMPPTRWNIVFKKRSCDPSVTRTEWIPALALLVDPRHPVDLKDPEVSVLVEVFRATCGLCVSRNYQRCLQFNFLDKCLQPEIPTDIGCSSLLSGSCTNDSSATMWGSGPAKG